MFEGTPGFPKTQNLDSEISQHPNRPEETPMTGL